MKHLSVGVMAAILIASAGCIQMSPGPVTFGSYTWRQAAPPGTGAMFYQWEPGKWPMGLFPQVGPDGKLWMLGQAHAWSSADGREWTRHDKEDWGERIYVAFASFKGKFWLFGG